MTDWLTEWLGILAWISFLENLVHFSTKSHKIQLISLKSLKAHLIPPNPKSSHRLPPNPTNSYKSLQNATTSHQTSQQPQKCHQIPQIQTNLNNPTNSNKSKELPTNPNTSQQVSTNPKWLTNWLNDWTVFFEFLLLIPKFVHKADGDREKETTISDVMLPTDWMNGRPNKCI